MELTDEKVVLNFDDATRYSQTQKMGTLARSGFAEAAIGNYSVKLEVAPLEFGVDYSADNEKLEQFLGEYQALLSRYGVKFAKNLSVET